MGEMGQACRLQTVRQQPLAKQRVFSRELHLPMVFDLCMSRGSSVSTMSEYIPGDRFDPWQRRRIFPLASVSRPALRLY
jgi:hypothetical protein